MFQELSVNIFFEKNTNAAPVRNLLMDKYTQCMCDRVECTNVSLCVYERRHERMCKGMRKRSI